MQINTLTILHSVGWFSNIMSKGTFPSTAPKMTTLNETPDSEQLLEEEPIYSTTHGRAYQGNSKQLLQNLPSKSVDLVVTSPPFALQRKKEYGNKSQAEYGEWFMEFAEAVYDVLTDDGSFVVDIGGGWEKGEPVRSMYHFELLTQLAGSSGPFHLAQDFYWYNPAKLPTPAQWVTIERIRAKDAVNHVWWLSKTPRPEADNRRVLQDFSDAQEQLMESGVESTERPSGHSLSDDFGDPKENGSIPPNLLEIANTASNTHYLKACRVTDSNPHPARFPRQLPEFFIKFLSTPGDMVLDIFAGSNMTGWVAQNLERNWLAFEENIGYLDNSKLRFTHPEEIPSYS